MEAEADNTVSVTLTVTWSVDDGYCANGGQDLDIDLDIDPAKWAGDPRYRAEIQEEIYQWVQDDFREKVSWDLDPWEDDLGILIEEETSG